jgi:NAD(P)H-dependent flavin oxidoreductase YrpB (nitropropane dioxygenase family)
MADSTPGRIQSLLGCRHPLVLAGMGGVARSELVAAVSEAGGFGFLGMVREPPALIRREVDALRRRGIERFGVNIIPAATDRLLLDQQVDTLLELDVPVVALFWAPRPRRRPPRTPAPPLSSPRDARPAVTCAAPFRSRGCCPR